MVIAPASAKKAPLLSKSAEVSVITIGPYQPELYSAFGHSGIRIFDPERNIDWVYDYGRFDFDQENFYLNFARGKLLYSIGRFKNYPRFRAFYEGQDRYIYEQLLNLTQQEKQDFFDFLETNYQPENREYFYNYVYDNCATKIPEVIMKVVSDTILIDDYYKEEDKTIRELMDDNLAYQPWGDWIIDVSLGRQIDKEATKEEYMFLPFYVYKAFERATIQRDTASIPLVKESRVIYEQQTEPEPNGFFTPFNVFVLLFFVVGFITNRDFKKNKRSQWLDAVLFTIVGIFGWWFVFLWFGTEHLSKYNWNLLWAFPLHLPLIFFLKKDQWRGILSRVYRYISIVYVLLLVFWVAIPQPLHQALIPLIITLALRSFYISYDLGKISSLR
jgi:hypothetical protein